MNIFINISGVYEDEAWAPEDAVSINLRGLDGCCCYCDADAEEAIRAALAHYPPAGLHWIDTGDYHYISKLWMEKIEEPFALALFDNHPDDQPGAFGSILSCGGWVRAAREGLPMLKADYLNTADIPGSLPVYLSIDLDVMPPQFARTDWSQGNMALDELQSALGRIAGGHRIIGADICGGLTVAQGATAEDLAVNVRTRKVLEVFLSHLT